MMAKLPRKEHGASRMAHERGSRRVLVVAAALQAMVFALDLVSPLGFADGTLHVVPLLLGLGLPRWRAIVGLGISATLLTIVGAALSPPHAALGAAPDVFLANRAMALVAIAATVFVVARARAAGERERAVRSHELQVLEVAESLFLGLDPEGRVTLLNAKARETLGWGDELIGETWWDVALPSQERADAATNFRRLLEGEGPMDVRVERPTLTRSGQTRRIAWHCVRLSDESGRVLGVLCSGEDVTHRRRVEAALDVSTRELRDMKHALDEAAIVAATDARGRITYVNDMFCAISGYARAELIGQDHRILNSATHSREFMSNLWSTITGGGVWRGEIRNRAKDGHFYWVDTTIVPFVADDGRPYQYLAIRSDITARKEAEERLIQQAALAHLGQMASVVAHEVKNPLGGVIGALSVLRDRQEASQRAVFEQMISRLQGLAVFAGDVLSYARPAVRKPQQVDVLALARRTLDEFADDPTFVGLEVGLSGESVEARIDPGQLERALRNLLLNAAEAQEGRGRIDVAVVGSADAVRIDVIDDGPGVPPEIRDRAADPFLTTKRGGTGLGLAVVQRVAEQHGGRFTLRCPEGGGTTASLAIPRRGAERATCSEREPARPDSMPQHAAREARGATGA